MINKKYGFRGVVVLLNRRTKWLFFSFFSLLTLFVFFSQGGIMLWAQGTADPDRKVLPTNLKEHFLQEDIIETTPVKQPDLKANVLFLVDTSNSMVYTPQGNVDGDDSLCTYGIGGRIATIALSYGDSTTTSYLDGRDVDAANNRPGDPDCYYSPDPARPFLLTFKPDNLANYTGAGTPKYNKNDLMPNDSRLYQMKLIFNRLLTEETETLNRIRFGLATSYVSQTDGNGGHVYYRKAGTGANQNRQWAISSAATSYGEGTDVWFNVKRAFLRVPFGHNSPDHVAKFRMLMDGIEDNTPVATGPFAMRNPELTTTGQANMATGIFMAYGSTSTGKTDVRDTLLNKGLIYYSTRNKKISIVQNDLFNGRHILGQNSGEAVGSVLDFFSPPISGKGYSRSATWKDMNDSKTSYTPLDAPAVSFPIRDFCEPNWLVVFTAGDNVGSAYRSSKAVENLYHYTKNNNVVRIIDPTKAPSDSNLEAGKLAYPIRTMVIGFVDKNSTKSTVVALRNELNRMADVGMDGIYDGKPEAYFANDIPELMKAIRDLIGSIVVTIPNRTVPSSPALVVPSGPDGGGYQPSFIPKSLDQWEGIFNKFLLNSTATEVTTAFSLGDDLKRYAKANKSGRSLYAWNTTGTGMLKLSYPSSTTTLSDLSKVTDTFNDDSLFTGGVNAKAASAFMLRWLFGQDTDSAAPNTSFTRESILTDLGAGYTLMRPLSVDTAHTQPGHKDWVRTVNKNQPETIFIHTNDGMLHAIDNRGSSDIKTDSNWGREHWAFIPPNALHGQRLLGLKFKKTQTLPPGNTGEYVQALTWINSKPNEQRSTAAYLLDGNPYAYNLASDSSGSTWRSVLVGLTGRGGAGLYAVDITNPIIAPQNANFFLWSIENNLSLFNTPRKPQNGSSNWGEVHIWNKNGHTKQTYTQQDRADYDRLGLKMPPPIVGATLVNGKPRNVGILAAGIQYDLDLSKQGNFGSALYLFDPLDPSAKVIKYFDNTHKVTGITDTDPLAAGDFQTQNPKMGMMITPPSSLTQRANTKYLEGFFTADSRGQIFEGRFTKEDGSFYNNEQDWTVRRIATLRDPSKEQTGEDNFPMPYPFSAGRETDGSIWLANGTADVRGRTIGENLFQLSPRNALIARKNDASGRGLSHYLFAFKRSADLVLLRSATTNGSEEPFSPHTKTLDAAKSADNASPSVYSGWIIPLARSTDAFQREYLSGSTLIYVTRDGKNLFAPTFVATTPEIINSDDTSCETGSRSVLVKGNAHLYKLELTDGTGLWSASNRKYYEFKGIKMHAVSLVLDPDNKLRMYVAITILDSDLFKDYLNGAKKGKLVIGGSPDYEKVDAYMLSTTLMKIDPELTTNASVPENMKINYWRELFPR